MAVPKNIHLLNMDRLECSGCHILNNSSNKINHSEGSSSSSPDEVSMHPQLPATVFISVASVVCLVSNILLAVALIRTWDRSRDRTKAVRLRCRLRGLILNLATIDLITVALLSPFEVLILAKDGGEWDFGSYLCRLFLGADVLLGSAAAYGLAALALYCVHSCTTWPILTFSWLLSASISVPVFVLADVISLPFPSGPQFHCSLPLALTSGSLGPPAHSSGGLQTPFGLLVLRLTGSILGFVLPTVIILVSNVEAVVRYFRSSLIRSDPEDDALRELKDETFKLCFVLSLSHVLSTFPRFAYAMLFLVAPETSSATSVFRIPPLVSPEGLPPAFFMSVLHYSAPVLRPAIIIATCQNLRKGLSCSPAT